MGFTQHITSGAVAMTAIGTPLASAPLPVADAVALFEQVCGDTLPGFERFEVARSDAGFAVNGTHESGMASVTTEIEVDGEPICTLSFPTAQAPKAVTAALTDWFGPLANTPIGRTTRLRQTLLRIEGPISRHGQDIYRLQYRPEN